MVCMVSLLRGEVSLLRLALALGLGLELFNPRDDGPELLLRRVPGFRAQLLEAHVLDGLLLRAAALALGGLGLGAGGGLGVGVGAALTVSGPWAHGGLLLLFWSW